MTVAQARSSFDFSDWRSRKARPAARGAQSRRNVLVFTDRSRRAPLPRRGFVLPPNCGHLCGSKGCL